MDISERLTYKSQIGDYGATREYDSPYPEVQTLRNALGEYEDLGYTPVELVNIFNELVNTLNELVNTLKEYEQAKKDLERLTSKAKSKECWIASETRDRLRKHERENH